MKVNNTCFVLAALLATSPMAKSATEARTPDQYRLGPEDQIVVRVADVEEISGKVVPVDLRGYVDVPLIGAVHAAGKTADSLRAEIKSRLSVYVNDPQVSVTVAEYRSQPVSVLGSVNKPGVYPVAGENTLLQLISRAGGLSETAGNTIQVTRANAWGRLPLPSVSDDPVSDVNTARIRIRRLLEGNSPAENIVIKPNDIITVPRAETVYVIGAVRRPGGFVLNEKEQMSVLQALALAEGLERISSPRNAKIIRRGEGGARQEIPADLNKILAGKATDVPLQPNDVLFVPNSRAKNVALRTVEAALQMGTGVVIFRR